MSLSELANSVTSREDFVAFVYALIDDYHKSSANWENNDLESYLDAVAAWTEDSDGYFMNAGIPIQHELSWRFAAQILTAARIYE